MNRIFFPTSDSGLIKFIVRTYAFKSDLKIKWVRPEKIPCFKPQKSGDLSPMPQIDKSQYLLEFRKSKELETANEYVKRLFTLEFTSDKQSQKTYLHENMEKVKRHNYDTASIEVRLARWTGKKYIGYIRAWQEVVERFPQNKKLKVNLKELIDKRRKHLKYLRKWDYKKFEWILDELNITYKPPAIDTVTRKGSLIKLTNNYCEELKQEKLDALRHQFEEEQPAFLEEKIRSLEYIRNEQKQCGVEVTVEQTEIDQVKAQLADLNTKRTVVEEN